MRGNKALTCKLRTSNANHAFQSMASCTSGDVSEPATHAGISAKAMKQRVRQFILRDIDGQESTFHTIERQAKQCRQSCLTL